MKQYTAILFVTFLALAAAENGYKYPTPPAPPAIVQQPPLVSGAPRTPINVGGLRGGVANGGNDIFSAVQAPPLPQYNQALGQPNHAQQALGPIPAIAPGLVTAPAHIAFPEAHNGAPQLPYSNVQNHGQGLAFNTQSSAYNQQQQFNNFQQNTQISNFEQNGNQINYQPNRYQQQFGNVQPQRQQIITKDIYIHSAPEDQEDSTLGDDIDRNSPIRKNYRIVFIKAPSQNIKLAANALKRAQSANEEKTVIYVLSKKPDLSEVQAQLQQVNGEQKTSKPEVYFIKYKTQEEALRAQQEIQAQYDALGGSTRISDEGIAPVTSVSNSQRGEANLSLPIPISAYARSAQQSYSQQAFQSSSVQTGSNISKPSNGYLPVKAKK